jgi:hypothetical protein
MLSSAAEELLCLYFGYDHKPRCDARSKLEQAQTRRANLAKGLNRTHAPQRELLFESPRDGTCERSAGIRASKSRNRIDVAPNLASAAGACIASRLSLATLPADLRRTELRRGELIADFAIVSAERHYASHESSSSRTRTANRETVTGTAICHSEKEERSRRLHAQVMFHGTTSFEKVRPRPNSHMYEAPGVASTTE